MAKKKIQEPQFIMSDLNSPMLNYRVYIMNLKEKVLNIFLAFAIGGAVGLTFYGGLFKNEDGSSTDMTLISNVIVFIIVGAIAAKIFLPMQRKNLLEKRKRQLTLQFSSFLDSLAVSLSSGMNMTESLSSASNDLKMEYSENAYMVKEVDEMIKGMNNSVPIEKMMMSLGDRSQIDDIKNFAAVFDICFRAGGNIKDIVRKTNGIICEKIEIEEEIETKISSNKTQFNAMMVIPVVLMLLLRFMSSSFAAGFSTIVGVAAISVAICIFVAAYKLGKKIMDIK